jgi:uncharacterized protein (DUF885 family)
MRAVPAALHGYQQSLLHAARRGQVAARRQIDKCAEQCATFAGLREADGFFSTTVKSFGTAQLPNDLSAAALLAEAAYADLGTFLTDELRPLAPIGDAVGAERYALASREFLGATVDLQETYEWGWQEFLAIEAELREVAERVAPGQGVQAAAAVLDADPSYLVHGVAGLQAWMQGLSDRAVEELGRSHFDIPSEIRRLECMIAPTQEGGIYYTGPSDDFSRAGRMWWSVPEGVTEFDTWRELTTVYHEGVPGHHLQIAQATYNKAQLNSWRRIAGTSGHAEGWALYAERLMEQLGYLDDPADRLGMLDGQRMRAARVVLDIGVHLEKQLPDGSGPWTGEYAFGFLGQNVNMNEGFVRFEVNRYLGWPGQAPSYKIGQRIWEQLRDEYARREGDAFDIKAFHKKALDIGGVGLDTLKSALLD